MTERAKALRKCWGSLPEKRQKLAKKKPFVKTIQKIAVDFQGVYTLYIYYRDVHMYLLYACIYILYIYLCLYGKVVWTSTAVAGSHSALLRFFRRRFSVGFKKTMAFQPRVIKQNRGSSDPELLTFAALKLVKPPFFWGCFGYIIHKVVPHS